MVSAHQPPLGGESEAVRGEIEAASLVRTTVAIGKHFGAPSEQHQAQGSAGGRQLYFFPPLANVVKLA